MPRASPVTAPAEEREGAPSAGGAGRRRGGLSRRVAHGAGRAGVCGPGPAAAPVGASLRSGGVRGVGGAGSGGGAAVPRGPLWWGCPARPFPRARLLLAARLLYRGGGRLEDGSSSERGRPLSL